MGRAIAANQRKGLPTDFLSLKLPPETMNYVPKLVAVKNIILAPAFYNIDLESIPDQPYFTTVAAPEKIDVKLAAKLAGMPEEEFVALNPSHNKPVAMAHSGTLVLPLDKADAFRENLEGWDQPLVTWTTIQGKKGESVDAIAKRYGLTGATLRQVNNLQVNKKNRLTASQPILVPGRGKPAVQVAAAKSKERAGPGRGARGEAPAGRAGQGHHERLHGEGRRHALRHRPAVRQGRSGPAAPEQPRAERRHPARPAPARRTSRDSPRRIPS